ncbi:AraC family transcriptional regulator [Tenacibaculum sp. IB213877]|uniref:AraC family transcriptional regulator n=1 Tax=Tenacibaculum sp. IB213877 TaxID=3097351 RepID=UPI002A59B35B|nr:AraC family transcriptional regulator [Tenacibaculum sp. IB213877]MDY0779448.1 AraC family transcriptional regulator [Tenacibaculum sp. IB213877]
MNFIKNKTFLLTFFVLISSYQIAFAQATTKQDSLLNKSYDELEELFYKNITDTLSATKIVSAYTKKAKTANKPIKYFYGRSYLTDLFRDDSYIKKDGDSLINLFTKSKNKEKEILEIYLIRAEYYLHNNKISNVLKETLAANTVLKKYKNDSIQALVNIFLGLAKSDNGEEQEALKLLKEANKYVKKCKKFYKNNTFASLQLNIPIQYKKLGQMDSAYYYINQAEKMFSKTPDTIFIKGITFLKGGIEYNIGNHEQAILFHQKSISFLEKDLNYRLLIETYSKIGKSYETLKDFNNAFLNYKTADSLYDKYKIKSVNLIETFSYLSNYYKKLGKSRKQLEYLNKLISIKEKRLLDEKNLSQTLSKKYDKPKLIEERNKIVAQLEQKALYNKLFYYISILIVFGILVYQVYRKRKYKKRFLRIVNQDKLNNPTTKIVTDKKEISSLSEEIVNDILKKLDVFESKNGYLNTEISLNNLADQLKTNSNYLSKVINQTKDQSFSNYINQLRIEYTVKRLKKDPLLRKYTIKAIANEVGFKNPESFSKAFFKFTNLKPSYFIKELETAKNN